MHHPDKEDLIAYTMIGLAIVSAWIFGFIHLHRPLLEVLTLSAR